MGMNWIIPYEDDGTFGQEAFGLHIYLDSARRKAGTFCIVQGTGLYEKRFLYHSEDTKADAARLDAGENPLDWDAGDGLTVRDHINPTAERLEALRQQAPEYRAQGYRSRDDGLDLMAPLNLSDVEAQVLAEAIDALGAELRIPQALVPSKPWTDRTGRNRIYLNGWHSAVGVRIDYYKAGNVSYAEYKGERVSNSFARKNLVDAKVWVDEDGQVHVNHVEDRDVADDIREAVQALISSEAE